MLELRMKPLLNELKAMKQRMDALYSENFTIQAAADKTEGEESSTWQPYVDVWETEGEWIITADLPGVTDEDLQVEVLDRQLTIAGKRETNLSKRDIGTSRAERPRGTFSRTFVLPHKVRQEEIAAELKRGVLSVRIPKENGTRISSQRVVIQPR